MATGLSDITPKFIEERVRALKGLWGDRNDTMDDMEKLYELDVWQGDPEEWERRVTSPRPFFTVETTKALLFTRMPTLEVPPSVVQSVADQTASRMEKHLYGAWDCMGLSHVIDDTEWFASCLGLGVIRVVYDPLTPVGEFPLMAQPLDPRTFYNYPDPRRPLQDMEVAHHWKRPRREIEAEWGEVPGGPTDRAAREEWLDQKVEFTDYWCTRLIEEAVVEEEEPEEEPKGILGRALEKIGIGLEEPEVEEKTDREGDANREKKLKRKVINAVIAEGEFVKKPVIMPGYERLPFFRWAGIRTPLDKEHSCLSILWPIAGGERTGGSQGLIATENELLSMKLRLVEQHASAAIVTNDENLTQLDASPGAVNRAGRPDYKIDFVVPPGPGPDLADAIRHVELLSQDATLPDTMLGRYQAAASGVALSLVTNPVLMRIAARQREREEVLQALNKHLFALTEEYAPTEGWAVRGQDHEGRELEEKLEPGMIRGYRHNRVHLSAQLPKDAPAEALMLRSVVDSKMLSRRSGIERLQQILNLSGQSPEDELKRIMVEAILLDDDDTRRAMALRALEAYDAPLANVVKQARQEAQQAVGPRPPGGSPQPQRPPGPLAQGPMQGMPPQAVPPQAVPPAVGGRNLQKMQNMMQPRPPQGGGP